MSTIDPRIRGKVSPIPHVPFFIPLMVQYAVIINGKKQEVDLRFNKAYDEHDKDKDHVYESLD